MSCTVLYSKADCDLCDDAREMLERLGHPFTTAEAGEYAPRVPVITVDGRVVTEGRVSERAVRRAVKRAL